MRPSVSLLLAVNIVWAMTTASPAAMREEIRSEIQELLDDLDSGDLWTRRRALERLEGMGPEASCAVPTLLGRLAHRNSYSEFRFRNSDLAEVFTEASVLGAIGQPALAAVTEGLRHEKVNVRMGCAMAINYMGRIASSSADNLTERVRNDADSRVRTLAIYALRHVDCPKTETVDAVADCLQASEQVIRVQAAETLGCFGASARTAVPVLCRLLSEAEDDSFRVTIAEALGRIGSAEAVPCLIEVIDRRMPIMSTLRGRKSAIRALGTIGEAAKPALPVLFDILNRRNSDVYFFRSAAWAIEQIDPDTSRHVDLLLKAKQDGNAAVRENAQLAIDELCEARLLKERQRANQVPREEERNKPQADAGGRTTDGK